MHTMMQILARNLPFIPQSALSIQPIQLLQFTHNGEMLMYNNFLCFGIICTFVGFKPRLHLFAKFG